MIQTKLNFVGLWADFPQASDFISYFEETWSGKIAMWITGNQNFPNCGHDINVAI